jgi:hypothetical protein
MTKIVASSFTIIVILFSFNIYFELRNVQRVQHWYDTLLSQNGEPKPDFHDKLLEMGFKTIMIEENKNGTTMYVVAPPFDQGLFTTFSSRYFFPLAIYKDNEGRVYGGGLYK